MGTDQQPVPPLVAVERAIVRLRRHMARRHLTPVVAATGVDPTFVGVLDAVEEGPPPGGEEVTVGIVAARLGVDPSRGSRAVAAAVSAGYVERVASQADGRRIGLRLTSAGAELAARAHAARQAAFDEAMSGWAPGDRRAFAQLLTRFVDGVDRVVAG